MNAYLDASVLVAMFTVDEHSASTIAWLPGAQERLSLSTWGLTEFTSALGVAYRTGRFAAGEREAAEAALREWMRVGPQPVPLRPDDVGQARNLIRGTQVALRAGDALHLAIAQRLDTSVATFDRRMALAAADLGIPVEDLPPHP